MKRKFGMIDMAAVIITAVYAIGTYFWLGTYPMDKIFNVFEKTVKFQEIKDSKYEYGQFAGLPAGNGIPVLENKKQLEGNGGYYTFETDSVIPLGVYRLKDKADTYEKASLTVFSGKRPVGLPEKTIFHEIYTCSPGLFEKNLYNQYYMVCLPDGAYACAFLDDYYYGKYKWAGKVQLPIGRTRCMTQEEQELLESNMEPYDAGSGKILEMFSESRYKENKGWYGSLFVILWFLALGVYFAVLVLIRRKLTRR